VVAIFISEHKPGDTYKHAQHNSRDSNDEESKSNLVENLLHGITFQEGEELLDDSIITT